VPQAFGGGNCSGPVPVAAALAALAAHGRRQDFEVETFVAHALRADGFDASEDGTGRGTPLVVASRGHGDFGYGLPCLRAEGGDAGGGSEALIAFDTTQITIPDNRSNPEPNGACHPLAVGLHPPAIAWTGDGQTADALSASEGKTYWHEGNNFAPHNLVQQTRWGVRRLMPVECERLQAFPDNWTAIEWRGKPAEQCPDGPRYKAVGNSMPGNVMAWIGERIDAIDTRPPQADLFARVG
jgi:DNA (cytosine-5)-methyltransferase 1